MKKAILLAMLCTACFVSAQDDTQPPVKPPMPSGPSEDMKKLSFLVGDWSGPITITMNGQESKADATSKVEWVNRSNFLRITISGDMQGTRSDSVMYLYYDPVSKAYKSYAFTDMSPEVREETGTVEGSKLVLTSKPWIVMGQSGVYRTTLESTADGLHLQIEQQDGSDWKKLGDANLKKAGGSMSDSSKTIDVKK